MSQGWKQIERDVGEIVGGKRYPANQGGDIDVESTSYVVQVKHRRSLSLEQITQLVEMIELVGTKKGKRGLVIVKVKRGRGKPSPFLVIQSVAQWKQESIPTDIPTTETEKPQ